jgi:hypothetical protein
MKQLKHWQDPVNALLGLWLIVAPWVLGYQADTTVMANHVAVGAALVAVALGAVFVPKAWEEWTEAALGLWLAISPWVLKFTQLEAAKGTALVTGLAVLVLALWVLFSDKDYGFTRSQRAAG